MFAVEVTHLEKRFRRRRGGRRLTVAALTEISFTIDRGECVAAMAGTEAATEPISAGGAGLDAVHAAVLVRKELLQQE